MSENHRLRLAGVLDDELTKREIEYSITWEQLQDVAEAVAKADREATAKDWVELQKRNPDTTAYLVECTDALEDFTRDELKALGNVKAALAIARSEGRAEIDRLRDALAKVAAVGMPPHRNQTIQTMREIARRALSAEGTKP